MSNPPLPLTADGGLAAPVRWRRRLRTAVVGRRGLRRRLLHLVRFGTVGASGVAVNEALLAVFVHGFGVNYLVGAVLATQGSTLWNFLLIEHWAFRDAEPGRSYRSRLGLVFAVNNAALLLRGPILLGLTSGLGVNYLLSNLISLGVLMLIRFTVADSIIWGEKKEHAAAAPGTPSAAAPAPGAAPVAGGGASPPAHPIRAKMEVWFLAQDVDVHELVEDRAAAADPSSAPDAGTTPAPPARGDDPIAPSEPGV